MKTPLVDLVGRTISHYRLVEKIGSGGMGVVYGAQDTHLDRMVAVKILPPEAVVDPERKRRFVQEAKSASALNHPNIIHIYDIDERDGVDFIAMEYVPGKTLDESIGPKGLPTGEALKYAIQIADALAAAHANAIVHRDLKPANIMVTEKGLVKVLDFGLAKLIASGPALDAGATLTLQPITEEGIIIGTVAYMAPEQVEGKKIDGRSDIFSFGSVLYEMVTGRRAFEGDSKLAVLSAILNQEPKPVESVLPELERIIGRCLRKDPDRRFQHMADVRVALDELKKESDSGKLAAPPQPKPARFRRPLGVAGLALGGVLIAAVAWFLATQRSGGPSLKNITFAQLTDAPGPELYPSLSPDGKSFVYQGRASGKWDICFQRVGGKTAVNLTKDSPADNTEPAFSPDGERLAFRSERDGGGIFIMGATGESVKRLTDFGYNPTWSPDGNEIACATAGFSDPNNLNTHSGQLFIVHIASGEKRPFAKLEDVHQPHWSPNGYRIAYWARAAGAGQRDLWTVSSSGGTPVPVTNDAYTDWNPVWSPDGHYLYFSSDRGGSMNLWRVPIAEKTGKILGPVEPVITPAAYSGYISISRDGHLMLYAQKVDTGNLYKVAFDPSRETAIGPPVPVTRGSRETNIPDLSPDGQWVAFQTSGKQEDISVIRTDGTGVSQITEETYRARSPEWSPDGKQIAFMSDRSGKFQIWIVNLDGSGLRQITEETFGAVGGAWSPDGARFAYRTPGQPQAPGQLLLANVAKSWTEQKPDVLPVLAPLGGSFNPRSWSPDGRQLALGQILSDGTVSGIFVYDLASRELQKIVEFGDSPRWLSDCRRLLFASRGKLYLVDSGTKRAREVLSVPPNVIQGPTLSRDDRTIVFRMTVTEADIWMATLR